MEELTKQMKELLYMNGADLVGVADITKLDKGMRKDFERGISIAVALDPVILNRIGNGPTREYLKEIDRVNELLNKLDLLVVDILKEHGYNYLALSTSFVDVDSFDHSTVLPHKTVATMAGIGWIGKSALLVTKEFGSAVRLSTVLTDAPLKTDAAIETSKCGSCIKCVNNCPALALTGALWDVSSERKQLYDFMKCRNMTIKRSWNIEPGETICGLCILSCAKTLRYIKENGLSVDFPSVDIAKKEDLLEILELQKTAYLVEAERYNVYTIPPLIETIDDISRVFEDHIILKIVKDRKIVGTVRAKEVDGTCYIARLAVHPEHQNIGYAKKLMKAIELVFEGARFELFTGEKSEKNLKLYKDLGYKEFKRRIDDDGIGLVYLQKTDSAEVIDKS